MDVPGLLSLLFIIGLILIIVSRARKKRAAKNAELSEWQKSPGLDAGPKEPPQNATVQKKPAVPPTKTGTASSAAAAGSAASSAGSTAARRGPTGSTYTLSKSAGVSASESGAGSSVSHGSSGPSWQSNAANRSHVTGTMTNAGSKGSTLRGDLLSKGDAASTASDSSVPSGRSAAGTRTLSARRCAFCETMIPPGQMRCPACGSSIDNM